MHATITGRAVAARTGLVVALAGLACGSTDAQSFSIGAGSQKTFNPFFLDPGDVLAPTGFGSPAVALDDTLLDLIGGDEVDAISIAPTGLYPNGTFPQVGSLIFGVDEDAVGAAGSAVASQASGNGTAGDMYISFGPPLPVPGSNLVFADAGAFDLAPLEQDELDGFDLDGANQVIAGAATLYFSVGQLSSVSPLLAQFPDAAPGDVFSYNPTRFPPVQRNIGFVDLGLDPGDDIDALVVIERDNGLLSVLYSLTAASPSIGTIDPFGRQIRQGAILGQSGLGGPAVLFDPDELGLDDNDELDALDIEDVPQTQPILPPQPPQTPVFRFPPVLTFFGFPIPFDPVVTIGYDFHVLSGPAFATFAPPDLAFGDDTYEVIADGTSTTIVFGERHEFPPGGVSSFQVRGIEVEAGIDPLDAEAFVAELGFVATGVVEIVMIPITEEVGGCNGADLAEPFGILSQADVAAFVDAFFANDPRVAQLASPFDVVSQADVNEFVSLFFEGCPVQ